MNKEKSFLWLARANGKMALLAMITRPGIDPKRIEFEITEAAASARNSMSA
ncbi:hypothetical protein HFO06_25000 [Rhizobium leguminosarum]|uniref:hypothetical protein n=1 Tax=Rhizobium leguminosarum TaxID=384 RepID=UPI001C97A406|nr:hypothetical protein [Rhizobium leguminosarum]MBY5766330.1 hypothetical protein [Rhizobium leguminosarum]